MDILIGTHRVLSRDVRAKDLGLLIVDEEQRFGVKQKELLRQLKLKVDVIAMSATPIPRTLQMSLAGLRDISVIETPPEGRRPVQDVRRRVRARSSCSRAIVREHARGGQAFFLHNRVESIDETAERLRALCPGVRFAVAHGQMGEGELEAVMMDYLRGGADVLVCTSIIESGIDIPQANTLIVEHADTFGLAQLYQIRGRVGRSRERAYAYLLYDSAAALTPEAAQRLSALSDYTELGRGLQDRDARPRDPRRRQPARRRAVGARRGARASSCTCRCSTRRCAAAEPEQEGEPLPEPVRLDVERRRLRAGGLRRLRAGEDRRAPARGGGAGGGRRGAPARGAAGPLRAGAGAGGEPARAAARAHQVRRRRGRARSASAATGWRSCRSSWTPRARGGCARSCRRRCTNRAARRCRCVFQRTGGERFPSVVKAADALLAIVREAA